MYATHPFPWLRRLVLGAQAPALACSIIEHIRPLLVATSHSVVVSVRRNCTFAESATIVLDSRPPLDSWNGTHHLPGCIFHRLATSVVGEHCTWHPADRAIPDSKSEDTALWDDLPYLATPHRNNQLSRSTSTAESGFTTRGLSERESIWRANPSQKPCFDGKRPRRALYGALK